MESLPVVETFYSLQGEGAHTGWPACFIRLAGCRNACSFCDTAASWDERAYPAIPIEDLVRKVQESGAGACVVTGGEPTLHSLDGLCRSLKLAGIRTWLETSGSEPLSGEWDWICLSPKQGIRVCPEYYRKASELKIVISRPSDFVFAQEQAARTAAGCLCYLQPEWSIRNEILPELVRYIQAHPRWKLSLQMHKFIGIV